MQAAAYRAPETAVLNVNSCMSSCMSLSAKVSTEVRLSDGGTQTYVLERRTLLSFQKYCAELSSELTETLRSFCLLRWTEKRIWPRRKRCDRKQKRGKRGSASTRLKANPTRPALPSVLLANVRSLDNKLDYIKLQRANQWEMRDCCVFIFIETWLQENIANSAIQLDGLTSFRADRDTSLSGKTRGGGLCVYVNREWCTNAAVAMRHCSPLIKVLSVKCRPFYLPRAYSCVMVIGVYLPPSSNANQALAELYEIVSKLESCAEKVISYVPERLPTRRPYTNHHEVLRTVDLFQFAYRSNRSTEDAISSALHLTLTHLDKRDTYVRMLFIDFSSAFNTIIPQKLIVKLSGLGINTTLCNWILDFLTERPQSVRIGCNTSSTITLSTGVPQGCVLSPLLFTLLTHDCRATHKTNHIIKFADDTTVLGLISGNNESAYREEVKWLSDWCRDNNLSLNVDKTKEIIVDFRRTHPAHLPLSINGSAVEIVRSTKFLGVHITEELTWTDNTTSLTKKAQQRLHFLRRLKRASLHPSILITFYRGTIESVLTSCITTWYGNCNAFDRKRLQRIVKTAENIIGVPLPSLQDIFHKRSVRRAYNIVQDPSHPSHRLFSLLPSKRRFCSIRASFYPQAVRLLNSTLPPRIFQH
ncbi:hypothetical protein M9458_055433 [Cirrhinus mrigala]|uniref:Reverse transcriptase domain-containing protein n=1 Tax=Cirrhinus mrigala TaxID=683832 RepID=A0ABD0MJV7_CIRMR